MAAAPAGIRRHPARPGVGGHACSSRPAGLGEDPLLGMAPGGRRWQAVLGDRACLPSCTAAGGSRAHGSAGGDAAPAARRGIGPWTAAEVLQRSNGAADALTTGDLNLPGRVGYALTGRRGVGDAEMLHLLAPYAGQRHRAARLILLSGRAPARRAPRAALSRIERL